MFDKVCLARLNPYSDDPHAEFSVPAKMTDALRPYAAVVAPSSGSHMHKEAFSSYLRNGYRQKLIE